MLSIIVPIYNVENYLPKCIDGLLKQTYSDMEIILIDDGSTDGCGEICDKYKEKDNRIKVVHKENGGLVSAWTRGVNESQGEYIGFVDSDDYCDNDYFYKLMTAVLENKADIGIGGYVEEGKSGKQIHATGSTVLKHGVYENDELEKIKNDFFKQPRLLYYARWLRVIKKELITDNLFLVDYGIKVGEDVGIALATLFDAKKIVLVPTIGYHYVWRGTSLLHGFSETEIENYTKLCANIEKICKCKGYENLLHREFAAQMTLVISKILSSNLSAQDKISYLKQFRENEYVKTVYDKKDYGKCSWKRKLVLKLFKRRNYKILQLLPVK